MDILQLQTLQKLEKEQSFSRTSRELGVSQPTVTTRIKSLEDELGENLVLRTGQKAILTESGKLFLSYVNRALQVYQNGLDNLALQEKMISIAATPTINTYILPKMAMELYEKTPGFKWRFLTGSSTQIIQMIEDDIADIGLIRGTIETKHILCYPLFSEDLYLVVPSEHPLASVNCSLAIQDLSKENILIYQPQSDTVRLVKETFLKQGIFPNITMELEHVMTVKQMVLAGMGIAFLPERTVVQEIKNKQLVIVPLKGISLNRKVSIVVKKDSNEQVDLVLKMLIELFKKIKS